VELCVENCSAVQLSVLTIKSNGKSKVFRLAKKIHRFFIQLDYPTFHFQLPQVLAEPGS
jgi:hypothetical protein